MFDIRGSVTSRVYRPVYGASHAIVIGIDSYRHARPLKFAVSDAKAIAETVTSRFLFPPANVRLLLDDTATKPAILDALFEHRNASASADDRLLVFFAGHGHTERSRRGEVGYLVPHDGDPERLGTLIRWQELTHAADMLDAKHVLFLMDACYGGLAVTRTVTPGSMRFLKDMLLRPARQVLTAGKADEPVADLGGPLPDHSPFTGHLLEALGGKATSGNGVITANGVMAYVYQAVGQEDGSKQTPHYGHIDGDGDFIFAAPILDPGKQVEDARSQKDEDVLVAVPAIPPGAQSVKPNDMVSRAKEYLSDDRHRLQLHETITAETRRVVLALADKGFSTQSPWSAEEFRRRIGVYESICGDLCSVQALTAHWGSVAMRPQITLAPRRLADQLPTGGVSGWIHLSWYPILLLLYSAGLAAVAAGRYDTLRTLFDVRVSTRPGEEEPIVAAVIEGLEDPGVFKMLPGHERHYTPRSEHLHKQLQPMLDDLFFLGSDYDRVFDRFEILLTLEYMHRADRNWGPPGRFGWKFRNHADPVSALIAETQLQGAAWPPLQAGLFNGSTERLKELLEHLKGLVGKLQWF